MDNKQTIPTDKGFLTIDQVLSNLAYTSYATQRDYGMKHESLIKHGLGTESFRERYEREMGNTINKQS
jgi:hypothetical protein